jgi:hypothetical protein
VLPSDVIWDRPLECTIFRQIRASYLTFSPQQNYSSASPLQPGMKVQKALQLSNMAQLLTMEPRDNVILILVLFLLGRLIACTTFSIQKSIMYRGGRTKPTTIIGTSVSAASFSTSDAGMTSTHHASYSRTMGGGSGEWTRGFDGWLEGGNSNGNGGAGVKLDGRWPSAGHII